MEEDVNDLTNQISKILSETFEAALGNPIHFQVTNLNITSGSLPLRQFKLEFLLLALLEELNKVFLVFFLCNTNSLSFSPLEYLDSSSIALLLVCEL